TPGERVDLPILDGFAPNDNKNAQISIDEAIWSEEAGGYGNYAWMVFPQADYVIVAKKDGYKDYVSDEILVEWDIVKHDFQMERLEEVSETPEPEEPEVEEAEKPVTEDVDKKDPK